METMTIEEAAAFLKMHPDSLSAKAKCKEVPCAKPGKRYVFIKEDLVAWLRSQYDEKEKEECRSDYEVQPIGLISATRSLENVSAKLRELRTKTKRKGSTG